MSRPHPPAQPHGDFEEVFPDIFFSQGALRMPGRITISGSRNMIVLREGGDLTVVHSMRLTDPGLAKLEQLGTVKHVIRLAGFHGMDDALYQERYGARVWAVKGQFYASGFVTEPQPASIYFEPDAFMDEDTDLPIAAKLVPFWSSTPAEAALLLERDGGILIAGDSLQNWAGPDPYFNVLGRVSFRLLGFFKAHNIGPGWIKQAKPDVAEVKALLDLPWEHVLPGHGRPVIGGAKEKFRPAIERL